MGNDRLTMALYQMEQDDQRKRELFNQDMHFIFQKASMCRREHRNDAWRSSHPDDGEFCPRCLDDLHAVILTRDHVNPRPFLLHEDDITAILRQTFRTPISYEGSSGPRLHDLLRRIKEHIGPSRYDAAVAGDWPERTKR